MAGLFASLVGASMGFSCFVTANAIKKVPLSRQPWLHVFWSIVGIGMAEFYVSSELQLVKDINEIRADKGLPPMIGSNAWVRYELPDEDQRY